MDHAPSKRDGLRAASSLISPRPLVFLAPALALAVWAAGCSSSSDDNNSSNGSDTSITITEEHDWSFDENEYSWESPTSTARVTLDIENFHHGSVLITILDSVGATVFSKLYFSFDWFWYIDGEFSDVDFTSAGVPGLWTITLEYSEFTGDVTLVVDSTDAPPPDPSVPEPTSNSALLDLSFGKEGRATYEPDTAGARRMAVDTLGRIVACGTLVDLADGKRRLAVWRYTPAGVPDQSFGDGGVSTFEDSSFLASGAFDVTTDSINRVVVSGWVAPAPDRRTDLAVFRFSSLGSLDDTFDDDGLLTFDDGEDEAGVALVIDSIGRVLVAGTSRSADNTTGHLLLMRFLSSGNVDGSFSGDGIVRTTDATDRARDLVLVAGDEPLVLGTRSGNLILWKFNSGGLPDGFFGSDGVVTSAGAAGEFRVGNALAIKDDGTLGIAGVRFVSDGSSPPELALWRYEANGDPLLVFNQSGFITYQHPTGWAAGSGIRFDATGKMLVSGVTRSSDTDVSDASATLWRYFLTGTIDLSLVGSNGTGVTRFDPRPQGAGTTASSIILLGDGKVLASGAAFSRETNAVDLVIWRLDP